MTVIAWDGKTLAADKLASAVSGSRLTTRKLHRLRDGSLCGASGVSALTGAIIAWLDGARNPSEYPAIEAHDDVSVLVVRSDRSLRIYQRSAFPIVVESEKIAVGCGRDYASAVMFLGFDAVRAVEVASALDVYCGEGVDTLTFDDP